MAASSFWLLPAPVGATHKTSAGSRRSVWRRLLDALIDARMRRAEQEIALYLERTGGKLTDDVEREIERLVLGRELRH